MQNKYAWNRFVKHMFWESNSGIHKKKKKKKNKDKWWDENIKIIEFKWLIMMNIIIQ